MNGLALMPKQGIKMSKCQSFRHIAAKQAGEQSLRKPAGRQA
jgi:hypothetical protein